MCILQLLIIFPTSFYLFLPLHLSHFHSKLFQFFFFNTEVFLFFYCLQSLSFNFVLETHWEFLISWWQWWWCLCCCCWLLLRLESSKQTKKKKNTAKENRFFMDLQRLSFLSHLDIEESSSQQKKNQKKEIPFEFLVSIIANILCATKYLCLNNHNIDHRVDAMENKQKKKKIPPFSVLNFKY